MVSPRGEEANSAANPGGDYRDANPGELEAADEAWMCQEGDDREGGEDLGGEGRAAGLSGRRRGN